MNFAAGGDTGNCPKADLHIFTKQNCRIGYHTLPGLVHMDKTPPKVKILPS